MTYMYDLKENHVVRFEGSAWDNRQGPPYMDYVMTSTYDRDAVIFMTDRPLHHSTNNNSHRCIPKVSDGQEDTIREVLAKKAKFWSFNCV